MGTLKFIALLLLVGLTVLVINQPEFVSQALNEAITGLSEEVQRGAQELQQDMLKDIQQQQQQAAHAASQAAKQMATEVKQR